MIAQASPERDVTEYITGVMKGSIVAGKYVRLAVRRHIDDLKNAHARGWKFDRDIATRAVLFFPLCCRHSIGEWDGEAFTLSLWQQFVVWVVFGWKSIQTGYRRFRKAYISVARKNGKTTVCSALSLLAMFGDEPFEPGAEIYCAATKEDQAKILHKEAVRMVEASPALSHRATVRRSAPQRITWNEKNSIFRPLGSDKPFDGLNPHLIVLDELHAWREYHRKFFETMNTGSGARRQALMVIITTAGDDRSQLWIEEDDFCVKVLEAIETGNIIDDTCFAFIARIDEDDDPLDESVWPKANPNYAISVKPEYLRNQANEAKHKPTAMNQFLRYHCNVRVTSVDRLISNELWEKGASLLTVEDGAFGYGGFDIGRSDDWCAAGMCFPITRETEEGTELVKWEVMCKCWTCRDGYFPAQQEPFRSWIRNGHLIMCDGNQVDFAAVERQIVEWSEQYNITNWSFDPAFAALAAQRLQEERGIQMYKFYQTHRMYNEPMRRFVRELDAGRIAHGNEPVITWQAGNMNVNVNHRDEWMPDKSHKLNKIDGMVSVLMAFAGTLAAMENRSFYNTNELELG